MIIWQVTKAASGPARNATAPHQVRRSHLARESAGPHRELARPFEQLGVLEHAIAERQAGRHAVDRDIEAAELGGTAPCQIGGNREARAERSRTLRSDPALRYPTNGTATASVKPLSIN